MPTATITPKQRAAFWRLFARAAAACGIPSRDRDAWRHKIMAETIGVSHLADVGRTSDFDRLMARLAFLTGDPSADRYSVAEERRLAATAEDCARQVLELAGAADLDPIVYIGGVLRRSGLSAPRQVGTGYWLDLPLRHIRTLLSILDTHRRRLLRRCHPDAPLAFRFGASWAPPVPPASTVSTTSVRVHVIY